MVKILFLAFYLWTLTPAIVVAQCSRDTQCEELYQPGSKCLEGGVCSNPFSSGCLNNFYSQNGQMKAAPKVLHSKRTCNSNDISNEDCEHPVLPYQEIRVHNGDWESAMMYSWIIQIFLSEFLQVPTTVGMNNEDTPQASFYAPNMPMSYSAKAYAWEELITANDMGGQCELTDNDCVHILPEVWKGQAKISSKYMDEGHTDQVSWGGEVGKMSWYIPVHTAAQYPGLTSYHGLTGQREKLASIFNRPTSWKEYCQFYSPTNCTTDDGVAVRVPGDEDEDAKYFQKGWYTGFFRPTEKNDCSVNPTTCTGHIVDSPCQWDSAVSAQAYWNDIALESDGPLSENKGYSYNQMIDIWRAANATQSHVVMWWWTPDATVEEFRGTSYQFQPILLAEPTDECHAVRVQPEDRCSLDPVVRRGPEGGGCDQDPDALQTIVASSLRDLTFETPEVDRSPGYEAIKNLKVSQLDMNIMLRKWVAAGRSGYAAREAVCEWVVDNQDDLESFIPRGYPRVFSENASYKAPLLYVAIGCGGVAVLYVLVAAVMVGRYSTAKVFVYAQVPFVFMVLLGMFLVACGSILVALEPHDRICASQKWFIALGYTLELVPLLVKIAAINRVVAATRRMKRVRISMQTLFLTVVALVLVVVVFMTLWTVLDSPKRSVDRFLKDSEVSTAVVCASDSYLWDLGVLGWNGVLILCATVLAFQSRSVKEELNDSQSLGIMIYSHFVFAVLRVVSFSTSGSQVDDIENSGGYPPIEPSTLAAASSFLLSVDVITAVTIYVVPKLVSACKSPSEDAEVVSSDDLNSGSVFDSKILPTARPGASVSVDKHGNDLPSGGEGLDDSDRSGLTKQLPSGSLSVSVRSSDSGHVRLGMDGNVHTDDERFSSSSDDEDLGGPRFAPSCRAPIAGTKPVIRPIEEGLDESTTSM